MTAIGTIEKISMRRTRGKRRVMMAEASIIADGQNISVVWFSQPYIANQYNQGDIVEISGKVSQTEKPYIANPVIKLSTKQQDDNATKHQQEALIPIYPETKHITSRWITARIEKILSEESIKNIQDPIPEETCKKLNLPNLYDALVYIHKPRNTQEHQAAKKRFIFERVLTMQVRNNQAKANRLEAQAYNLSIDTKKTEQFIKNRFKYTPTNDQNKAVVEILKDIHSNKPMARLLEGDVGSGKTIVAAAVMHGTVTAQTEEVTSGKAQVAYLAPTEVLAKQQFNTLVELFSNTAMQIGLMSGKECLKYPSKINSNEATKVSKAQLKKWIGSGEIPIVVGTHAIIQKNMQFKRLALVIIDEQHRFGVAQRQALISNTDTHIPHLLSITATPIPRTLALTIYGDLEISILQEVPKERKQVKTQLLKSEEIQTVYDHIKEEVKKGHQAYILCPRIQNSDESDLRSVEEEHKHIEKNIFPTLTVDSLHGKMKPKEKQEVMENFSNGKTNILVCTTIVEVGVNIPNATIIAIQHAERFGLAQLHQLRGRVIRSKYQPYCYAITDTRNDLTLERLKTFEEIHDGFILAQKDMEMRGSGELTGLRQSGIPDLIMEGLKNQKLLAIAQQEAKKIVETDPNLKKHPTLKHSIEVEKSHNE